MSEVFEGGIFGGTLYADFYLGGKWTGKQKAGNATKFELKANADRKVLPSNQRGSYGMALRVATIAKEADLNIDINDPVREVFTVGFLGEAETIAITAGSVTDEVVTAPMPGKALELAYREISAVTVTRKNGDDAADWAATTAIALGAYRVPTVANDHFYKCTVAGSTAGTEPASWSTDGSTVVDGTVTWKDMGTIVAALNTDYTIGVDGARLGWIFLTDDTRLEFEEPLSHDYTYAARSGYRVKGATQPVRKVRWFLDGESLEDGRPVYITVFETQAMPTNAIDFLKDDWQSIGISATPIKPAGGDCPWTIEYKDV